jgi:hypothetical protein
MSWIVAGLVAGVVAYLVDYVMWGKVFTKGMEGYASPPPAGQPVNMGPMLAKSAVLSLVFGVLFAYLYAHFMGSLWVMGGGPLAGMEFASILWLPILLSALGGNVWWDKVRTLNNATMWSWLARLLAAGIAVGLLVK